MSLQSVYEKMSGDYADVVARLRKDERIHKYLLKFKDQDFIGALDTALAAGDCEAAFLQAHTLKGLCANLSIKRLEGSASALTENLRGRTTDDHTAALMETVRQDYAQVLAALDEL